MTRPQLPPELLNSLADRCTIEDVIGRGGMATVYRAHDERHGRRVATKVLRPDLAASIGPERFLKEIEIAARLTHPHILPLYDSGDAGGLLYYVMPLAEGESLRSLLDRLGPVDFPGALELLRQIADALDYAHRRGVLHRDIKPENILLPEGPGGRGRLRNCQGRKHGGWGGTHPHRRCPGNAGVHESRASCGLD